MDISIVIPAYNREKDIEKCISSLINQLDDSTEIVIVDDGSDDNTQSVCQRYLKENVRFIKQEHSGVSAARNNGIQNSNGKYITFIDSDDFAGENYIEILKDAVKNEPEFVVFKSFERQGRNKKFYKSSNEIELGENIPIEKIYPTLISQRINNVWLKLFKADIIKENNIRFNKNLIIAEDYIFITDYICACKSFDAKEYLPYYFNFNISGTYSVKKEHLLNLITAYDLTVSFTESKCSDIDTRDMKKRFLQQAVETASKLYEKKLLSSSLEKKLVKSSLYKNLISCDYKKPKSKIEKNILLKKNWKTGIRFFYTVKALEKMRNHAD